RPMSRLGQQMFFARKRSGSSTDVGHEGVITGRDAFSLRSSISLIPKESPSLHSNQLIYIVDVLTKVIHKFW
ncbi:hypothetical protein, partial [Lysinibacillus sp. NPDC059133]|uniref:hypothetical protein n=1 Tax=Lysinibacillus sp. NPDC059133 TaxID=3346737 RepID=UPI0036926B16